MVHMVAPMLARAEARVLCILAVVAGGDSVLSRRKLFHEKFVQLENQREQVQISRAQPPPPRA